VADDGSGATGSGGPEVAALQGALAAEHAAIWGYGTVGAALPEPARGPVTDADAAHRDVRDRLTALISSRGADPAPAEGGYTLPFPVLSAVDAARLAVTLEEGTASAWAWVLDQAAGRSTREWAVTVLGNAEVRAVGWRTRAGTTPVTTAFPGLPAS
jgi:hypothetical protein